jgi:signal peptidase I
MTNATTEHDSTPVLRGSKFWTFLRDVAVILLSAIVISFLIKTFLVRSFYIPSASMENTLQINDRIMVNQLVPKVFGLNRGDVVVFTDPGGWLSGHVQGGTDANQTALQKFVDGALSVVGITAPDSNDHLVKRLIGLPGDHVTCCNVQGQVEVNGVGLNEPYVLKPSGQTNNASTFDVTVPANSLFVMGDNRYNSRDSRFQTGTPLKGFVPISSVVGQAFVVTWPADRWAWLGNYPQTFQDVPAPTISGQ